MFVKYFDILRIRGNLNVKFYYNIFLWLFFKGFLSKEFLEFYIFYLGDGIVFFSWGIGYWGFFKSFCNFVFLVKMRGRVGKYSKR